MIAKLNKADSSWKVDLNVNEGKKDNFTGEFNVKPSNKKLNVKAPENAKPLTEVVDQLGLRSWYDYYLGDTSTNPFEGLYTGDSSSLRAF
jgi:hypothetical protein